MDLYEVSRDDLQRDGRPTWTKKEEKGKPPSRLNAQTSLDTDASAPNNATKAAISPITIKPVIPASEPVVW